MQQFGRAPVHPAQLLHRKALVARLPLRRRRARPEPPEAHRPPVEERLRVVRLEGARPGGRGHQEAPGRLGIAFVRGTQDLAQLVPVELRERAGLFGQHQPVRVRGLLELPMRPPRSAGRPPAGAPRAVRRCRAARPPARRSPARCAGCAARRAPGAAASPVRPARTGSPLRRVRTPIRRCFRPARHPWGSPYCRVRLGAPSPLSASSNARTARLGAVRRHASVISSPSSSRSTRARATRTQP